MRIVSPPPKSEPAPLALLLIDRIGLVIKLALITLIWLLPHAAALWALAVVAVLLLHWARRRATVVALVRAAERATVGVWAQVLTNLQETDGPSQSAPLSYPEAATEETPAVRR